MTDYTDLKLPDRVWAWGSELMGEWDLDPTGGTEYIRADIHAVAIAALEATLDHWRKEWDKAHYAQQEIISEQETRRAALEAELDALRVAIIDRLDRHPPDCDCGACEPLRAALTAS